MAEAAEEATSQGRNAALRSERPLLVPRDEPFQRAAAEANQVAPR